MAYVELIARVSSVLMHYQVTVLVLLFRSIHAMSKVLLTSKVNCVLNEYNQIPNLIIFK